MVHLFLPAIFILISSFSLLLFLLHFYQNAFPLIPPGLVNPGCVLPPVADPTLYFIFDNCRLESQKDEIRQRGEFSGDRIYAECLLNVLRRRRLLRRCISTLLFAFDSKFYQERLFCAWNVLDFLVPGKRLTGKPCSDAIEVSHSFSFSFASLFRSFFYKLQIIIFIHGSLYI